MAASAAAAPASSSPPFLGEGPGVQAGSSTAAPACAAAPSGPAAFFDPGAGLTVCPRPAGCAPGASEPSFLEPGWEVASAALPAAAPAWAGPGATFPPGGTGDRATSARASRGAPVRVRTSRPASAEATTRAAKRTVPELGMRTSKSVLSWKQRVGAIGCGCVHHTPARGGCNGRETSRVSQTREVWVQAPNASAECWVPARRRPCGSPRPARFGMQQAGLRAFSGRCTRLFVSAFVDQGRGTAAPSAADADLLPGSRAPAAPQA